MSSGNYNKPLILFLSIALFSKVAYNYYFRRKKKIIQKEIHEVIMFSYGDDALRKSKYSRCYISPSMDRLLYYLNYPRHSLDICMYVFTNVDISNVILKLHYRGVKIRVIIDADMAFTNSNSCHRKKLEKQGIPIRWMKSTNLMHHKFCLMDVYNESESIPLVMLGSLNWTNQALSGNWEDVAVTSQRELVNQYRIEFERLWLQFTPIV